MSDSNSVPDSDNSRFREPITARCPNCDSVVKKGDVRCLMCGEAVTQDIFVEAAAKAAKEALERERELARQRWTQQSEEAAEDEDKVEEAAVEPPLVEISEAPEDEQAAAEVTEETPPIVADVEEESEEDPEPILERASPTDDEILDPDVVRSGHQAPQDFGQKTARPLSERIQKPAPVVEPAPRPQMNLSDVNYPWRPSPFFFMAIVGVVAVSLCGLFALRMVDAAPAVNNVDGTATALAVVVNTPTNTPTLTATPDSSATATPSETPTVTPTPFPTDTPQPPRFHTVQSGETIISIALLYGITVDSIIEANGVNPTTIQGGQDLQIPWPTATPPLQPLAVEVGEEVIVVDPSVCPPFYEIKEGDNIFGIAAQNRVPFDAMLSLNRLTIDSVVRPGDVICIPAVIENGVLPPTPGPSPTPSNTPAPAGPQLLYPAPGSVVANPDGVVALQWLAVKDLTAEEYYMIEVTDLTDPTAHPRRGFTRSNSFQLPSSWRAPVNEVHEFRWRVSIVHVTDFRADGSPIYTYGGRTSEDATFFWLGAVPTATPTATPTLTPTPTNTPEPTE